MGVERVVDGRDEKISMSLFNKYDRREERCIQVHVRRA